MQNYRKYINVSQTEKNWGFYITTVGCAKVAPHKSYPNNKEHPIDHSFTWNKGRILDGYYAVFITKGEGILESAKSRPLNISAGMCFLLFPGVWHRYKPNPESGWEEYWVGFKGKYPDALMNTGHFNAENPLFEVGLNEEILSLFHQLIKQVQTAEIGYPQIIPGITFQILGQLHAISRYKTNAIDIKTKCISKVKFLLQESIESPVNLEELVKELPMSYSKFRKAFKEATGQSPNQYHLNLRLNKAKELLSYTNLSINEIAYQTGFESIFYFSTLFKKKIGLPPKSFRNVFNN